MAPAPPWSSRLADLQHRRAGLFALVALLLAAASVPWVAQLGLNSAWEALLPKDKPSVIDLERAQHRVGGFNTLALAIESNDLDAMQRFASDLVPRLEALPKDLVRAVDWNIRAYEDFVWEHRQLYADLDDLEEARDSLEERLDYEKLKNNPFYVPLDDEKPPDPRDVIERMRKRADEGREKMQKYPGGFYVHADRDLLVIFLRSDMGGGDAAGIQRLIDLVQAEADALDPTKYASDLTIAFAGNLVVAREEHEAIKNELLLATSLTIAMVLLVIFIFFRNWRALFILGGSLGVPVLVTFAFAEWAVDYLNTSTAFLGSIVIGNGINPNIIWLARYFEERRRGRSVREAIERVHGGVWLATFTASMAAAVAYGSLVITDFRGFRDFGIIGGTGMVLCWFGAILVLPALCALNERFRPLVREGEQVRSNVFGTAFARMAAARPGGIVRVSMLLGVLSCVIVGWAIANDPLEYDFRNLKSVREGSEQARTLNKRIGTIATKAQQGDGIAVVVDTVAEARALRRELERRRDEDGAPWGTIYSIDKLLPDKQQDKLPVLEEIRDLLLDYRKYTDDEETLREIDEHIPPAHLRALSYADVPEEVARAFTEKDGTRGRVIIVSQKSGRTVWDGRYLIEWTEALRQLRTTDNQRPALVGRGPVFADMISVIFSDGPRAILASLFATMLLVIITFRSARQRFITMLTLLLGIAWMGATMALAGMKLNFLNFVAFPITFGNGVDYGVNVMRRYAAEPGSDIYRRVRTAVEETGGAVILCSLTTVIGYSSLYTSANKALNSFGAAMAISEITCLLAAVLTMPALLILLAKKTEAPE